MQEILWKYLIGPIVADAQNVQQLAWKGTTATKGYNPVNTAFYAVTSIIVLLGIYKLFHKKGIKFTTETAVHTLPFVLIGGTLRFLQDASAVPYPYSIVLITPLIYFLVAAITLPAIYYLENRRITLFGTLLFAPLMLYSVLQFEQFRILYIVSTIVLTAILTFSYRWIASEKYSSFPLVLVAFTQLFEGVASMLSSFYGYNPKQLLAQLFTALIGFPGVLVMKVGVLALAISVVTDIEDENMKALALLTLYAIGLGTGFRVFLRVLAGV